MIQLHALDYAFAPISVLGCKQMVLHVWGLPNFYGKQKIIQASWNNLFILLAKDKVCKPVFLHWHTNVGIITYFFYYHWAPLLHCYNNKKQTNLNDIQFCMIPQM